MSATLRVVVFLTPLIVVQVAHASRMEEDAQLTAALTAEYETNKMVALEPGVIDASQGRAKRDGANLTLKVVHGPAVTLTDDKSGCEAPGTIDEKKCYSFTLVADLPSRHAFIVSENFYEGGNILLIDARTGARAEFSKVPRFSPNGSLLLVISNSEASDDPRIQLWSRKGNRITKEWEVPDAVADQQTEFVTWNDSGIQLDLWHPAFDKEPERHRLATLARGKSGWELTFNDNK